MHQGKCGRKLGLHSRCSALADSQPLEYLKHAQRLHSWCTSEKICLHCRYHSHSFTSRYESSDKHSNVVKKSLFLWSKIEYRTGNDQTQTYIMKSQPHTKPPHNISLDHSLDRERGSLKISRTCPAWFCGHALYTAICFLKMYWD